MRKSIVNIGGFDSSNVIESVFKIEMPFGFLFPKQNSLKNGKKSSFPINICSFSLAWNSENKAENTRMHCTAVSGA